MCRVFDEGCIATVNSAKLSTSGKESDPSDQNVLNEKTDSTCLVESTTGIFRLRFSQITVVRVGRLAISMSKGSSNRTKKPDLGLILLFFSRSRSAKCVRLLLLPRLVSMTSRAVAV